MKFLQQEPSEILRTHIFSTFYVASGLLVYVLSTGLSIIGTKNLWLKKVKLLRIRSESQWLQSFTRNAWNSKKIIGDPETDPVDRMVAVRKLRSLPLDANPNRIMNRCSVTGRPHAVYRKFGLSRITLREMASEGKIPGMTKASW